MKILWKSDMCIIPNFGVTNEGDEIELPEDVAKKFIESGQAKAMPEPKTKQAVKGEDK